MVKKIILTVLILAAIMYAEYRYIMLNLSPSISDNGTVYIEIFDQVDEYCVE